MKEMHRLQKLNRKARLISIVVLIGMTLPQRLGRCVLPDVNPPSSQVHGQIQLQGLPNSISASCPSNPSVPSNLSDFAPIYTLKEQILKSVLGQPNIQPSETDLAEQQLLQILDKIQFKLSQSKNPRMASQTKHPFFIQWGSLLKANSDSIKDLYEEEVKKYGLTPLEFVALRYYTTTGKIGSYVVNSLLGSTEPLLKDDLAVIQPLVDLMDSALKKLPDFKGEVKRGAEVSPLEMSRYTPGKIIQSKIFSSSSASDFIEPFSLKSTYFRILSKHGKNISHFSSNPSENEVLFPRGTRFKVIEVSKIQTKGGPKNLIILEEVDE